MTSLLLLVLLGPAPVQALRAHVRAAASFLKIQAPTVEVVPKKAAEDEIQIAWVDFCFECPRTIYVRADMLQGMHPHRARYLAYHETCHIRQQDNWNHPISKKQLTRFEAGAEECSERLIDHFVPTKPNQVCGPWYTQSDGWWYGPWYAKCATGWDYFAYTYPCDGLVPTHVDRYNKLKNRRVCDPN